MKVIVKEGLYVPALVLRFVPALAEAPNKNGGTALCTALAVAPNKKRERRPPVPRTASAGTKTASAGTLGAFYPEKKK